MEDGKVVYNLKINHEDIDSYLEKAKQYVELLEKAKTLAEELASLDFEVKII